LICFLFKLIDFDDLQEQSEKKDEEEERREETKTKK
jgi:hypothetical protein